MIGSPIWTGDTKLIRRFAIAAPNVWMILDVYLIRASTHPIELASLASPIFVNYPLANLQRPIFLLLTSSAQPPCPFFFLRLFEIPEKASCLRVPFDMADQ